MNSESTFTHQDTIDTANGVAKKIREREAFYIVPVWSEVVNAMSRYAYKELYDEIPSIDEGMYEYVQFTQTVDNVLRHECNNCIESLIPENATNNDAFQFNRKFSKWRENAIDTVSPEDDSPRLRESVLYAISIDTVASFANRTVEQINALLGKKSLSDSQRAAWEERARVWEFRSSFLETSRRMSMDLSEVNL